MEKSSRSVKVTAKVKPLKLGETIISAVADNGFVLCDFKCKVVKCTHPNLYFLRTEQPASCTENGKEIYVCDLCDYIEYRKVEATGHTFGEWKVEVKATKDKEGLGKKGDYIGLEVNMRCPCGNTPNMLSIALDVSFYEAYADIITTNTTPIKVVKDNKITIAVSRKERFWYKHSEEEIWNKYGSYIKESGWYDDAFVRAMGRRYFYAKFPNLKMAKEFQQFVHDKF
jgi:hypothetical protein